MPRRPIKRIFTADDDALILRHMQGEFSARELERKLRTSHATLVKYAEEKGYAINYRRYRQPSARYRVMDWEPEDRYNYQCSVGDDLLLQKLRIHHPERDDGQ